MHRSKLRSAIVGCTIWFIAFGLFSSRGEADAVPTDVKAVADSINEFGLDLYAQLAKSNSGNLFFSPYSISTALAMTYAGACGETAAQMRQVLHFALPSDRLHAGFAAIAAELMTPERGEAHLPYEIAVANSLWGQRGYLYAPDFIRLIHRDYSAELCTADFAYNPEQAREEINRWVAQKTHDKFQKMFSSGTLNSLVRSVLVNAIYLKASWAEPFETALTVPRQFHLNEHNGVAVPFMFNSHYLGRGMENADLQALHLYYRDYRLSMVVLLPRKIEGLAAVEKQLNERNLTLWLDQMHARDVQLYFPKFGIESELELAQVLSAMGMAAPFGDEADFSGISLGKRLHLSNLVHRAFVDVNEEGTEAAAASGGVTSLTTSHLPMTFQANHSFLFIIWDNDTRLILFIGRICNPQQ